LIEDIGNVLGCGAHVVELRRTGFAHFDLNQSITFEKLETVEGGDFEALDALTLSADAMLPGFGSVYLSTTQTIDIKLGRKIQYGDFIEVKKLKMFDENRIFLGIGESNLDGEVLPKRLFI